MQHPFAIAEARGHGLILATHLHELGVNSRRVRRALAAGELVRVHRGAYARPPSDRALWPGELHALRVRAAMALEPRNAVVSHVSAAASHGLPLIGPWPSRVHVSVAGARSGSSSAGIARHIPAVAPDEVQVGGVRVTSLARTLVDVASTNSFLAGVTMMDAALRAGGVTKDELANELLNARFRVGVRRAHESIAFADARSHMPGESLTRVRAWELGFERPELQIAVTTRLGQSEVDFGWESCALLAEFDGEVKYTRGEYLRGRTAVQALVDEKAREDAIRAQTGRRFLRIVWSEALSAPILERMLRESGVSQRAAR
ncbi:MAG: type IV toxin-antitoxin system AbiEi family antitoxin domain-containing protein [Microbacteriaceae bacterium]